MYVSCTIACLLRFLKIIFCIWSDPAASTYDTDDIDDRCFVLLNLLLEMSYGFSSSGIHFHFPTGTLVLL